MVDVRPCSDPKCPITGMIPNRTGYTLIGQDAQLYPFY